MFQLKLIAVKVCNVFDFMKFYMQSSIVELKAKIKVTDWLATKHLHVSVSKSRPRNNHPQSRSLALQV